MLRQGNKKQSTTFNEEKPRLNAFIFILKCVDKEKKRLLKSLFKYIEMKKSSYTEQMLEPNLKHGIAD